MSIQEGGRHRGAGAEEQIHPSKKRKRPPDRRAGARFVWKITAGRESWSPRHANFRRHRCENRLRHRSCGSALNSNARATAAPSNCGSEPSTNVMVPGNSGWEPSTSEAPSCHGCMSATCAAAASTNDCHWTLPAHQAGKNPPTADDPCDWFVPLAMNRWRGYWNSQILPAPGRGRCCCLALPRLFHETRYSPLRR